MVSLETLLETIDDGTLMDIELELLSGVVPATSNTRKFAQHVNRMIDQGTLCIDTNSYRKVYLPSLSKAVHKELARRYIECLTGKREIRR